MRTSCIMGPMVVSSAMWILLRGVAATSVTQNSAVLTRASAGLASVSAPACLNSQPSRRSDCSTGQALSGEGGESCQARSCCWQPTDDTAGTSHKMPWCFYNLAPRSPVCDRSANRVDCGYAGIDEGGCKAKGCCWKPSSSSADPWCFYSQTNPPNSDVMVHLFEWRWDDIARECKTVLGPAGYKSVQVSPPQEDILGKQWWTRYQPVSYKIFSRSGDRAMFQEMVKTCREAGVDIVVDGVLNHMANSAGKGRNGTSFQYRNFPSYSDSCGDFHHNQGNCQQNCNTDNARDQYGLQNCDLGGLPDLNTGSPYVQSQLSGYLNDLASLGVAGLRLDAAKHINPADLQAILSRLQPVNGTGAPLYFNQEVIVGKGRNEAVRPDQYYGIGRVWEFKLVEVYNNLIKFHNKASLSDFKRLPWGSGSTDLYDAYWADSQMAMSFVVNHDKWLHGDDRPATVTYNDGRKNYELALITLLAHEYGQPNILSSYKPIDIEPKRESNRPYDYNGTPDLDKDGFGAHIDCAAEGEGSTFHCEHRWPAVKAMVQWRRVAGPTRDVKIFDSVPTGLAIRRDNAYMILSFGGGSQPFQTKEFTGLPPGAYCNVLLGEVGCRPDNRVVVGADKTAVFKIANGDNPPAVAMHIQAKAAAAIS